MEHALVRLVPLMSAAVLAGCGSSGRVTQAEEGAVEAGLASDATSDAMEAGLASEDASDAADASEEAGPDAGEAGLVDAKVEGGAVCTSAAQCPASEVCA